MLAQPETGMGYQVVEATLRDNKTEQGIAYNAELLFLGNESQTILSRGPYPIVLRLADRSSGEIKALRVLTTRGGTTTLSSVARAATPTVKKTATSAKEAPIEDTKADEVFKRFSAYENDRRVTPDRSLLPGSYATTEEDAKNVKTGKQAVVRYALPNPEPASYVFTITPKKDTKIQRGTVEPANDQPGGGAEVIFSKGTDANTVTLSPAKIPDE